jgi:hypothetical protein
LDLAFQATGPADDRDVSTFKKRFAGCKLHAAETWGLRPVAPVGTASVDGTQLNWESGWLGWDRWVWMNSCS